MNQMELKTHEVIQFFLPRLTVALEDIAKELKTKNEPSHCDTRPRSVFISKCDAYQMLQKAGIPVMYINHNDDITLQNGELLIGTNYAFLEVMKKSNNTIGTSGDKSILREELTEEHINKFITDYKALEKKIKKDEILECESRHISKIKAYGLLKQAGIPVKLDEDTDVRLLNGNVLICDEISYLCLKVNPNKDIYTTSEVEKPTLDLTVGDINKFITEYKNLEKEISK